LPKINDKLGHYSFSSDFSLAVEKNIFPNVVLILSGTVHTQARRTLRGAVYMAQFLGLSWQGQRTHQLCQPSDILKIAHFHKSAQKIEPTCYFFVGLSSNFSLARQNKTL
jgi:hypothetical protein